MKIFVLIIVMGMAVIGIFLGWRVLGLLKRVKELQAERNRAIEIFNEIREEKAKQSDQLRLKGIEIDELKKELDKYSDVEIKVALTLPEKRIILNALEFPQYKARIQEPKTKRFIRIICNTLKEKIKESIKKG